MKFGKTLREALTLLPKWYHKYCIPYKNWKIYLNTKNHSIEEIELKIRNNVKNINYVTNCILRGGLIFRALHKNLFLGKWYFHIILFIKLNSLAMTKLCKKIDKRYMCNHFSLLNREFSRYDFMNQNFLLDLENKFDCKLPCFHCAENESKKLNLYIHCPYCFSEKINVL